MSRTTQYPRGRQGTGPAAPGWRLLLGLALLVLGTVLVIAWVVLRPDGAGEGAGGGDAAGAGGADTVAYELRGDGPPVRVTVEVAATPEERRRGLSNRASVPEGTGMVFLFPEDGTGAFWMRETLVPLSIAYVAADGEVVSVHEMTPCEADPCPVYEPEGPYRYALELPAGAFGEAGVGPGDEVVPLAPAELPAPS
jgi:uncharacterized protein